MSNGNDDIRIIVATCPETLGTFSNYCSKLEFQLALSPKEFITPVVHLAQNHLVQKRPLSAKLFRAKFNHPKVQLAQNSVL